MEDTNRRIRTLAQGRRFWLLETRDALRDPSKTTASALAFRSGHMASDPGPVYVHEGIAGALAVGEKLSEIVKMAVPPLPSSYSDAALAHVATYSPGELLTNPAFTGTSGTLGAGGTLGTNPAGRALAGMPTGWVLQRYPNDTTTTFTVNIGEDDRGRYVEIVAATVGAGGLWLQCESDVSRIGNGDRWQGFATVEVLPGAVNLAMASSAMEVNVTAGGTASSIFAQGLGHPGGTVYGAFPSDGAFAFEDAMEVLTVPTDVTARNWLVCRAAGIGFIGAGGATVRIRRPRFEKVAPAIAIAA